MNLVSELNDQDEKIRDLIEKKNKINDIKKRTDSNLRTLFTTNGN